MATYNPIKPAITELRRRHAELKLSFYFRFKFELTDECAAFRMALVDPYGKEIDAPITGPALVTAIWPSVGIHTQDRHSGRWDFVEAT